MRAGRDQLRRDRPDVVQEQLMAGGLKMAAPSGAHDAEADETDVDHVDIPCLRQRSFEPSARA